MSEANTNQHILRKQVEENLRQLYEQSLQERIKRYLEVKPHPVVSYHHFSPVSAECIELYRDGHFYGCISLSQSVIEALVKFLCKRNGWKPEEKLEKNINKLAERKFISNEVKTWILQIWDKRHDYHHLNPSVETNRQKLEILAKEKLQLLNKVEGDIFRFTISDGKIIPANPKYWDIKGNQADVYLRCK
jgi:hypothetical protein